MAERVTEDVRRSHLAVVAGVTLALGVTVAVSWFMFGGSIAFRGPIRALAPAWPLIYGSQAVLAFVLGAVLSVTRLERLAVVAAVVLAAWVGEWIVLLVGGTLFANELVPQVAWFYWLIGTGGPVQPLAALAGAVTWQRVRRTAARAGEA